MAGQTAAGAGDGPRDEDGVRRFVEHMAMTWAAWGFPRMPARVLMTMMAADEDSLTAAELSRRLDVSPAAISGAVRYLILIGMLVREPDPGSRRDRYRTPADAWYRVVTARTGFYNALGDIVDEGVKALGAGSAGAERITDMYEFLTFLQAEMEDAVRRWQETHP